MHEWISYLQKILGNNSHTSVFFVDVPVPKSLVPLYLELEVFWKIIMYLQLCNEKQLQEIYDEFKVTEQSLKNDVKYLMEWLEQQPHLPNVKDEDFLINFLLRCKNRIEKSKQQLDYFYTCKAMMPEHCINRDPLQDDIRDCFKRCGMIPLPKLTPEGYRVAIYSYFEHTKDTIPNADIFLKTYQMTMELCLKLDKTKGWIFLVDYKNVSTSFITLLITNLKQVVAIAVKITPNRYKKIYFLNAGAAVEPAIGLSKRLVKKSLADRMEVWKKGEKDFVEILPKDVLPSNYGGTEKSLEELRDLWYEHIKENRDWFLSQENVKADLSRRPKDLPYNEELSAFGLDGSFRKLAFD